LWKRFGAMLFGVFPLAHDDVQNLVVLPLPTVTNVEAAKSSWSRLSQGRSSAFQARSLCFHWNQSHLSLSALVNLSSSGIPSPPLLFGRHEVGQLIKEWPPYTLSGVSPRQRKLLLKRSILRIEIKDQVKCLSSWVQCIYIMRVSARFNFWR
jgi:hypothetical protein